MRADDRGEDAGSSTVMAMRRSISSNADLLVEVTLSNPHCTARAPYLQCVLSLIAAASKPSSLSGQRHNPHRHCHKPSFECTKTLIAGLTPNDARLGACCDMARMIQRALQVTAVLRACRALSSKPVKYWALRYRYVDGMIEKRAPFREAHLSGLQRMCLRYVHIDALAQA